MSGNQYRDPNFEAWIEQAVEACDWSIEEEQSAVVKAIRRLRRRGDELGQSMFTKNGGVYPFV